MARARKRIKPVVKKYFFIQVMLCWLFFDTGSTPAWEWDEESNWKIGGYFKNASSWVISHGNSNEMLKCENIFQLDTTYQVSDHIVITGIFRAYYDAVFDLEKSGWTEEFRFKDDIRHHNADTISDPVREFYADIRWNRFFIRLGKQQVAWGEAIGMKMLDVINPQDMRELNQQDFEDSNLPLWMAKLVYYPPIMGTSLQILLIPDIEPHYIPPAGYPFTPQPVNLFQEFVDAGFLKLERSPTAGKRVPQNLKNMEFGVKWYQNLPFLTYSLNYFYHWSDEPGLYPGSPVYGSPPPPGLPLNYELRYHRFHTLGGTFTKIFDSFLGLEGVSLKGEIAAHLNDRVIYAYTGLFSDLSNPFGIKMAKTDSLNYYLALDKFFFTDYYIMLQFFQFISLDHKDGYLCFPTIRGVDWLNQKIIASSMDKVDNILSLYLSTDYFQERLLPNLLCVYSDDGAFWFRGRCKVKYSDNLYLSLGINVYFGDASTTLGQYHNQDNLFLEVKYGF